VPWSVRLAPKLLEPKYDQLRDRIAAVEDPAGNTVGHLVTYAREYDEYRGSSGLRPKWRQTERLEGWFMPVAGRADEKYLDLDEVQAGTIWGNHRLRWLEGAERAESWQKYLDEWGPHESSCPADEP
jgi:hypothetical protein